MAATSMNPAQEEPYKHKVHGPTPHSLPVGRYWLIFSFLIFLTFLTVYLAEFDFGSFSIFVAMAVASVKASLVLAVFMHLWYDNKFYALIISTSLVFLSLFILFPMLDIGSRGLVDDEKDNFLPRNERVYKHMKENPGALELRPGLKEPKRGELNFTTNGAH